MTIRDAGQGLAIFVFVRAMECQPGLAPSVFVSFGTVACVIALIVGFVMAVFGSVVTTECAHLIWPPPRAVVLVCFGPPWGLFEGVHQERVDAPDRGAHGPEAPRV